jgi:hypothetical protein
LVCVEGSEGGWGELVWWEGEGFVMLMNVAFDEEFDADIRNELWLRLCSGF